MKPEALLVFVLTALAEPGAWATSLPIGGIYGDAEGCARANDSGTGSEVHFLLTPEGFSSRATSCKFRSMEADAGGSFTADSLCSYEGEENGIPKMVVIRPEGDATYTIGFPDGSNWGPLAKCS